MNKKAAIIAVICLAIPMTLLGINYTNVYFEHLYNSLIDSTPIGSVTPSTGVFTSMQVTNAPSNTNVQGSYYGWNETGGQGETDLYNNFGIGYVGGYRWYEVSPAGAKSEIASMDGSGNMTSTSFNGPLNGNATTATKAGALSATPSQCSGGTPISTGIQANGNANCTSVSSGPVIRTASLGTDSCSPPGSSYAVCVNTLSWGGGGFADTNYVATCNLVGLITGGGGSNSLLIDVQGPDTSYPPTTTTISVGITNNSSDSGTYASDVWCIGVHN